MTDFRFINRAIRNYFLNREGKMNQSQKEGKKQGSNILKSRDDQNPIYLQKTGEYTFSLGKDSMCSWAKKDEDINISLLRQRIEPWLTV